MGNLSFLVFFLTVTSRSLAAPERQANLGDLFGMMGGLMSAMAPEEDAKEIQQQMGEITQLLGGIGLAPVGPDSADVSLDLNAGAETPTGLFSEPVDACLQYFNNEVISGITLEECKEKCSSATSFICHSLEYEGSESRCLLSEESKKTQPSSYFEPCYDGTHSTYLEQIFTDGCYEEDTDYYGNDINMNTGRNEDRKESPAECQELCTQTEGCKFFTWKQYSKECWSKTVGGYGKGHHEIGSVSGPRNCDSADVSLDLNAGTEASTAAQPTGLFSAPVDACLKHFNNEAIDGITLEECKEKCSSTTSYVCHSLEYEQRCLLSEESKKTQPRSYKEPCYDGTHSTYLEQIFTDSANVSLDLNAGAEASNAAQPTGLFSEPVDACLKHFNNEVIDGITLEECKEKCSSATSFVCHSLEYELRCLLSEESKKTQPRSYTEPCYDGTHSTYLEQIFTDSADVSLDLNAGAEGSTAAQQQGLFSDPVDACLQYNNNEAFSGITLEQCKEKCASATSFICRSLDYEGFESPSNCFLSAESKKTQPSAYSEPCYDGTHSTYLEQIFTGYLDSARASSQLESSAHCWGGGSWCIWGPQFAIDGIIQTSYGKIFHSNLENYPWFEVELRNSTEISSVTIYNRPDCCGERFKNAEIRAGMTRVPDGTIGQLLNINTICGTYAGPGANGEEMRIDCASPIMAKFITVQLKDINDILQINEIRINING